MIAEDTDSVQYALRLVMEYLGHEVVDVANDGDEVLAKCENSHPEVVLMDVKMPHMDGLTCTALLAKERPETKVVIVTGGRTTADQARAAGASAFVEKPFDVNQLSELMFSLRVA
jgi:CheY-like chemotaxis protein